jgi:hypothetical protein
MKRESKNAASGKAKPRIEKARHKKRGEKKVIETPSHFGPAPTFDSRTRNRS